MNDMASVYRALSDKSRLRILNALGDRELCACQLIALLGVSGATVSQHMNILLNAQLASGRRDGKWIHYRRLEHVLSPSIDSLQQEFRDDQALLDQILSQKLEDITKNQRRISDKDMC